MKNEISERERDSEKIWEGRPSGGYGVGDRQQLWLSIHALSDIVIEPS
jgi:hypothetical protein